MKLSKYTKVTPETNIDVYAVLAAFGVVNPATQHAIKKLLMPGQRGTKSIKEDLQEAISSIERAIEIEDTTNLSITQNFGMVDVAAPVAPAPTSAMPPVKPIGDILRDFGND